MLESLEPKNINFIEKFEKLDKNNLDYSLKIYEKIDLFLKWKELKKELLEDFKIFFEEIFLKNEKLSENDKKIFSEIFKIKYENLEKSIILSNNSELFKYYKNKIFSLFKIKN